MSATSTTQVTVTLIAEAFYPDPIEGETAIVPPGWHQIETFPEDGIDWEAARKMVAKGDWRIVKETVAREIVLAP